MFPDIVQCSLGWKNHPLVENYWARGRWPRWTQRRRMGQMKALKTRRDISRDVFLHCQWAVNGLWWSWIALLGALVLKSIMESLDFRKHLWLVEILLLQDKPSIMRKISSGKGPRPFQCIQDAGKGCAHLLFPRLKLYGRLWHLCPAWENKNKQCIWKVFIWWAKPKKRNPCAEWPSNLSWPGLTNHLWAVGEKLALGMLEGRQVFSTVTIADGKWALDANFGFCYLEFDALKS